MGAEGSMGADGIGGSKGATDGKRTPAKRPEAPAADRARVIFGNDVGGRAWRKARRAKRRYERRFGDDSGAGYHLTAGDAPVIGTRLGVRQLHIAPPGSAALDLGADASSRPLPPATFRTDPRADGAPVVVGTIRMGFGHYRIAMAMASAARAMGYTPYWLDLCSLEGTTCAKVISHQNDLYSLGSRLSQRLALFNRLVWEPMNSEGFRRLSYNAQDQKVAELMAPPLRDLPRDVPFVGAHAWPAQAAVHAGLTHVVDAIPDNWPMALHLAQGAIHAVQTPSAYLGYRELRGMTGDTPAHPMPAGDVVCTGHYVDHELVANATADCAARRERLAAGEPVRYLLTVGGAGAQGALFRAIVGHLLPEVAAGRAALLVNVGDHRDVWDGMCRDLPGLAGTATCHFDGFDGVEALAGTAARGGLTGVHAFCDEDVFAAVYATNVLMRVSDVMVTKPSELSFYPVPKLMIHRVGGHEAWGAIRAAELGDGTYELDSPAETCAMIDAMQSDREIVGAMCDRIRDNASRGVYDGAYAAVRLAVRGRQGA